MGRVATVARSSRRQRIHADGGRRCANGYSLGLESKYLHATTDDHDDVDDNDDINDVNYFNNSSRDIDFDDDVNVDYFIYDWPRRVGAHFTRRWVSKPANR